MEFIDERIKCIIIFERITFELEVGDGALKKLAFEVLFNLFGAKIPLKIDCNTEMQQQKQLVIPQRWHLKNIKKS